MTIIKHEHLLKIQIKVPLRGVNSSKIQLNVYDLKHRREIHNKR